MTETRTTTAGLLALEERYLSPATRIPFFPIVVESGSGVYFRDREGRRFLDFHSMACILNVGHNHPSVVEAIQRQAETLVHVNSAYAPHEPMLRLAERLALLAPGGTEKRVAFGLSGGDANDGALKLARAATGRPRVIGFLGSYHGNTYGALSLSTVSPNMRRRFGPELPGVHHIPYPDVSRQGGSEAEVSARCLDAFRLLLETVAPAEEVAAVFVEPIQGDAGIVVPPRSYIEGLREICSENGILLVAEEVQTGIGRTGRWFASEHFSLEPDVVVIGKALGSGMPVSAIVARSELMDHWQAPGHVFSTGANPVCCAAALATLDVVENEDLLSNTVRMGERLERGLATLAERHPAIREVRGRGLMLGVKLASPPDDADGNRQLASRVVAACFSAGLYVTFFRDSVLRLAPPLIIQESEIDQALQVLDEALDRATKGKVPDSEVAPIQGW